MIKLIVTDMDGTLLGENGMFPPYFMSVFEELERRNILFCVASGRQYSSLLQFFEPIKEKIGFIAENGAFTLLKNDVLNEISISSYHIHKIIDTCSKISHLGVALCGKKSAYLSTSDPYIEEQVKIHYNQVEMVKNLSDIDDIIFKITICDRLGARFHSLPKLLPFANEGLRVALSGTNWIDINNISANKGIAIGIIQEKLGISKEETMVFGDFLNDLEMMRMAHFSYAMKNAQPEVKAEANFETDEDNTQFGVLKTICNMLKFPFKS